MNQLMVALRSSIVIGSPSLNVILLRNTNVIVCPSSLRFQLAANPAVGVPSELRLSSGSSTRLRRVQSRGLEVEVGSRLPYVPTVPTVSFPKLGVDSIDCIVCFRVAAKLPVTGTIVDGFRLVAIIEYFV